MYTPKPNERVFVRPVHPNEPVQRGEATYGQFLLSGWQEVLFNDFLHARMLDGSVEVKPLALPEAPKGETLLPPSPLPLPLSDESPLSEDDLS